jgi:hypothetical protein
VLDKEMVDELKPIEHCVGWDTLFYDQDGKTRGIFRKRRIIFTQTKKSDKAFAQLIEKKVTVGGAMLFFKQKQHYSMPYHGISDFLKT